MKRMLVLILLAGILAGCGLLPSGTDSDAKLIYAAIDDEGFSTGMLIISDVNGKKVGEVKLPEPESKTYVNIRPTLSPGIVIVLYQSSENDSRTFWANANTGEVKQLDIPIPIYNRFFQSPTKRFVVLELGKLQDMEAQLIDLQTGTLTDLNALFPGSGRLIGGVFSADESHLLMQNSSGLWLLPSANPVALQLISEVPGNYFFTPEGDQVIYTKRTDDITTINSYNITTKASKVVYETEDRLVLPGVSLQKSDEIVISKKGSLNFLNIKTGELQVIYEKPEFSVDRMFISASEKNMLAIDVFSRNYILIDLNTLEFQTMEELDGLEFWLSDLQLPARTPHAWVYFVDSNINPGTSVMKALELDSGKIVDILALKDEEIERFNPPVSFPSEGSGSFLMSGFNDTYQMKAWAVNNDAALVVPLEGKEKAMFDLGGISQDGRFGVYSLRESKEDLTVVVIDMKTGKTKTIASGTTPVWLVD